MLPVELLFEKGAPVTRELEVVSKHELVMLMLEQSGHSCFSSMSQKRPSDKEMKSGPSDAALWQSSEAVC